MKYRRDIDGLRAIAVLVVVFYHAGVSYFPGGFVGVDIFFVISGYLITSIILDDTLIGHYSIANFYVRRARRILPILYFVIVVVLLFGLFFLLPLEFIGLSESVQTTILFSSNFLFWMKSGYFDIAAELKPLLHTWSLAVEEQFYVVWPLILVVSSRHGWGVGRAIAVLLILSFAFSCLLLAEKPAAVFYLLSGRAWELLVGAWLATTKSDVLIKQWQKSGLSIIGLGLLMASVLVLNKSSPFPAWNALYPCLGSALLILAGEGALVNRYLLAWRPLVFVGLISYSLYLWHWPLLSYVRIMNLGRLPPAQAGIVVVLSFILATLSWRYVENPFRRGGSNSNATFQLINYALFGLMLCMVAWSIIYFKGFPDRIPSLALAAQEAAKDFNLARGICHLNMAQLSLPDPETCTTPRLSGEQDKTLAVWGDSHAEAMIPGVAVLPGLAEGVLLQMTKTSCPPLIGVDVVRAGRVYRECSLFNAETIQMLRQHQEITTVVLAARWPVYALEAGFGVSEATPGASKYSLVANRSDGTVGTSSLVEFGAALDRTIDLLARAGKKVIVVGAVPEMYFDVPGCVARKRMPLFLAENCGLDQGAVAARISVVNKEVEAAAKRHEVAALYPDRILCHEGFCAVESPEGRILYYDHNHLSTVGARYVFSRLRIKE